MSKEEILKQNVKSVPIKEGVLQSMEEYSKQQCISFYNWVETENTQWRVVNGKEYTTELLYNLFIQK